MSKTGKGFDGLFGLVRQRLEADPLSGHLFLFCNRPRTRLKVLLWDGSGLWVCAKRLEKGRYITTAYKCSDIGCNGAILGACPREMPASYHPPSLMNFVHALSRCGKWVGVAAPQLLCLRFITTVSGVGSQPLSRKALAPSFQPSEDARLAEAGA